MPTSSANLPKQLGEPEHSSSHSVTTFLMSHGLDVRREGVRILVGFGLLLILGVIGLNAGIWHNARQKLEREAWKGLEAAADVRRADVDHVLGILRREATSVAHDPTLAASAQAASAGTLGPTTVPLMEELETRAGAFDFDDVAVLDEHGTTLQSHHPGTAARDVVYRRAGVAAASSGQPTWCRPHGSRLALVVPIVGPAGEVTRSLVFETDLFGTLQPMLRQWPGFGLSSGAYLVERDGNDVVTLTTLAGDRGTRANDRAAMASPPAMAAAMAATGVASRVELPAGKDVTWAVTRPLENAPWGFVAQASRAELISGMTSVRQALAFMDLILLAVFLAIAFVWRRSYATGLARREIEITERHARRLQSVLDTAFDAIVTFDKQGRIQSANRAAAAMVGQTPTELEGQPIQRILHWGPSEHAISLPQVGAVVAGGIMRKEGPRIPAEVSLARTGDGEEVLFTAIARDMRERLEAERRLREAAEGLENSNRQLEEMNAQLEEASRLKTEFLANTSHELRTPLNGMIGFLQLVLDDLCDSPEEEREFLKQALQCSRHLLGLINDVLDIAKIEAGKLALEISRLELQQVFDEVYTVTHVQAAQKTLKLTFEDQTGEGVTARGDFGKVKQVLINLVGNSLKFTSKGEIRVRARSHAELGHVILEVEDTGIGIAPSRQRMVFEKFVQADGSTTRRFGGTGLGLAICKSLVELMGGIIGVHSDGEGKGTRVYFSLPVWRESHDAPPLLERVPNEDGIIGDAADPLVLVVEDDSVFRRFATVVLQRSGYRTVEAEHAEAAWNLARRLNPAVVVLDYALTSQEGAALRTGWDLARRMASEPETRHIPVVFVTGFDGDLRERLHSTAFARRPEHLVKPVEASALIAKITELARQAGDGPIRVLMADDDPTVSAYVRKVLPVARFQVTVAKDGGECLHFLRTHPNGYDILLLDLMMPEVSGYDVLREMTLSGIHSELPVMVLTNFPDPRNEEERRLLEDGMVLDVVSKSAVHNDPQLLAQVLDRHLRTAPDAGEEWEERKVA